MQGLNSIIGGCIFLAVLFVIFSAPKKNTFAIIFVMFVSYMAWNYYTLPPAHGGPEGMGDAMGRLLLFTVFSIGVIGMLTKGMWLLLASRSIPRKKRIMPTLLTFIITLGSAVCYVFYPDLTTAIHSKPAARVGLEHSMFHVKHFSKLDNLCQSIINLVVC